MYQRVFVVQDLESAQFLCPGESGDVALTDRLRLAGQFATEEEAVETALSHCAQGFDVLAVFGGQNARPVRCH